MAVCIQPTAGQSFNSQPPEGGWGSKQAGMGWQGGFNSQPPEGGWQSSIDALIKQFLVSTHSRPKAAGIMGVKRFSGQIVSTHSRPKAAGKSVGRCVAALEFQLTAARRRLGAVYEERDRLRMFQLTAARRRLANGFVGNEAAWLVSTHSRPKAAGLASRRSGCDWPSFNSQPPEGGWFCAMRGHRCIHGFQLTAARRRLGIINTIFTANNMFQLTAARRRLDQSLKIIMPMIIGFNSQPPEGGWKNRFKKTPP